MTAEYTELAPNTAFPDDLSQRLKAGEVFVARGYLQRIGLLEDMQSTSLEGIRRVAGDEVAEKIRSEGLQNIHRFASLTQIAEITDSIYDLAKGKAYTWVSRIAPEIFNTRKSFYFERMPNIRFMTPYDNLVQDLKKLEAFGQRHGNGKLTPHPPHRDSWVDCPTNLINVWLAVGPIPRQNGLTIFPEAFSRDCEHVANGSLAYHENPGEPVYIDLAAGDAIIFHGEHLHATVLNHIDATRHVISFRIVDEKPHYANRHYHHYLHSALAGGPLNWMAGLPANLSPKWVRTRLEWVAEKLKLMEPPTTPKDWKRHPVPGDNKSTFELGTLPVNSIKAVNDRVCVARVGEDKVIAFNRRCPHDGADFAQGSIHDGKLVCPWHNLPFDSDSGKSPCKSLKQLRFYETRIEEGMVTIAMDEPQSAAADNAGIAHQARVGLEAG